MSDMDLALRIEESKKDPNKVYSWVRDDKLEYHAAQARGYERVLVSQEGDRFKDDFRGKGVDGLVRVGDLVLMSCPRDMVEARNKERADRSNPHKQLMNVKEGFKDAAAAAGIRTVEDEG